MTLAYDSDKEEDETRFGGVIDPDAYYTVYADRSERRYDAASVRKLYLKLERPQFYALFGDYETGIDEPELARYVRAFNGVKAEYRSDRVSAIAFAADSPNRHRHDEIQGNGLSGPYALGARNILANSRADLDRGARPAPLRPDRRAPPAHPPRRLRHRLCGRHPALPRADPQPQLRPRPAIHRRRLRGGRDRRAGRSMPAAGRAGAAATRRSRSPPPRSSDSNGQARTSLAGADVRYRPSASTEIRAEVAVSDNEPKAGAAAPSAGTATAWQVEAEHHGSRLDLLAYAREREAGFGLGQTSARRERHPQVRPRRPRPPRRHLVADRQRLARGLSRQRRAPDRRPGAGRISRPDLAARAGLTFADDRLADGRSARSTILQLGATKRLLDNKLELDGQTEIPLGKAESIDFPARHRVSARYAVTSDIQLVGAYEIADGETIDARTARIGFDLQPWAGARIARQRQFPGHRRIRPAQLRRLRPLAVAGARRALVGRLLGRRQQDARRDRSRPGCSTRSTRSPAAASSAERRER